MSTTLLDTESRLVADSTSFASIYRDGKEKRRAVVIIAKVAPLDTGLNCVWGGCEGGGSSPCFDSLYCCVEHTCHSRSLRWEHVSFIGSWGQLCKPDGLAKQPVRSSDRGVCVCVFGEFTTGQFIIGQFSHHRTVHHREKR